MDLDNDEVVPQNRLESPSRTIANIRKILLMVFIRVITLFLVIKGQLNKMSNKDIFKRPINHCASFNWPFNGL